MVLLLSNQGRNDVSLSAIYLLSLPGIDISISKKSLFSSEMRELNSISSVGMKRKLFAENGERTK